LDCGACNQERAGWIEEQSTGTMAEAPRRLAAVLHGPPHRRICADRPTLRAWAEAKLLFTIPEIEALRV